MNDGRKQIIITFLQHYLGDEIDDSFLLHTSESFELSSFLNNISIYLLLVYFRNNEGYPIIRMFNELETHISYDRLVLFIKLEPISLTVHNIRSKMLVTCCLDPAVESLCQILRHFYVPILNKSYILTKYRKSDILHLLVQLESFISPSDEKENPGLGDGLGNDNIDCELSISHVHSPLDERQHWGNILDQADKCDGVNRATIIHRYLESIVNEISSLPHHPMHALCLKVDLIFNNLDDLWSDIDILPPYPEIRMLNFIEVSTNSLLCILKNTLSNHGVWFSDISTLRPIFYFMIQICDKWIDNCVLYTGHIWRNHLEHHWLGPVCSSLVITQFVTRLDELIKYQNVYLQSHQILTIDESHKAGLFSVFNTFSGINPFNFNSYTKTLWSSAVNQFKKQMQMPESIVAEKISNEFRLTKDLPIPLLRMYSQYHELLQRPTILAQLSNERECLLGVLILFVNTLRQTVETNISCYENRFVDSSKYFKNSSCITRSLIYLVQMSIKINFLIQNTKGYFDDLPNFLSFQNDLLNLKERVFCVQRERYEIWCNTFLNIINEKDSPLSLNSVDSPLLFNSLDGQLIVFFHDDLVQLLRDVRIISGLGFVLPSSVVRITSVAEDYFQVGLFLKQIAQFYNTIHSQIIPSQQPLMITSSFAFESFLRHPNFKGINILPDGRVKLNWQSPNELFTYVSKMQHLVESFSLEIRRLRGAHFHLTTLVGDLFENHLRKSQSRWKNALSDIRELIYRVEIENSYDPSHMFAWHIHWDYQLYKVLEFWYSNCFHTFHNSLPDIQLELVLRKDVLQFRPPLEEVRSKYMREIRYFLTIPRGFRGVTKLNMGLSDLFCQIIERNSIHLVNLFSQAENIIFRLQRVMYLYEPWAVFASGTWDLLQKQYCRDVISFEQTFLLLKSKSSQFDKLPNIIRVDCICISAVPAKSSIEIIFQNLFDSLLLSLKCTLGESCTHVSKFIEDAEIKLNTQLQNIEDVILSYTTQKSLIFQKSCVQPLLSDIRDYTALIRLFEDIRYGDTTLDILYQNISIMHTNWDKIDSLFESQDRIIQERIEIFKETSIIKYELISGKICTLFRKWQHVKPRENQNTIIKSEDFMIPDQFTFLGDMLMEIEEVCQSVTNIMLEYSNLSLPEPSFPLLDELQADVNEIKTLQMICHEYNMKFQAEVSKSWLTYRCNSNSFKEFLDSIQEFLQKQLLVDKFGIISQLLKNVGSYRKIIPILNIITGESYTREHWSELFCIIGISKNYTIENVTIRDFLCIIPDLIQKKQSIIDLNFRAIGEVTIRDALSEIELWSSTISLNVVPFVNSINEEMFIIQDWKEIVTQLSDNICLLHSIKDSDYYYLFKEISMSWENKLLKIDLCLDKLVTIQRKWLYLEPIFRNQFFPKENDRFRKVDVNLTTILRTLNDKPLLFSLLQFQDLLLILEGCLDQLDRCQKALFDYLEEKRNMFPRFFFISDEDLLNILGHTNSLLVIQSILPKLFSGVFQVSCSDENKQFIESLLSIEGEILLLCNKVSLSASLELWLTSLADEMKLTLQQSLFSSINNIFNNSSIDESTSCQITSLTELIEFTYKCEEAISTCELFALLENFEIQLKYYADNILNPKKNCVFRIIELKRKALILDTIHCLDIIKYLLKDSSCKSTFDWKWQKQIRYYFVENKKECNILMLDACFSYSFEYLGNPQKLVRTPLTDKCFLTLTQSMWMGMGGNPYGPAGTGKTESVKALGGLLGRQVLVFNCDEGIDVKSMTRIFIGIVKCGSWGCFDEFNRLREIVLSALSSQIQIIQGAIKLRDTSISLLGTQIAINPNSGIFITLNPAGKGYGGRQKLPDNLKRLFLPIAMSKPDNEQIAEVVLYSEGFTHSKELSTKLIGLFNYSNELLSIQKHYDWGLRAIKAVLEGAGSLLENARLRQPNDSSIHTVTMESKFIIQSVKLNTLSKLTHKDCRRFTTLISDVFPGVVTEEVFQTDLNANLNEFIKNNSFQLIPGQIQKCVELFEQLARKIGVLIIGPSGSGKSSLWKILKDTLNMDSITVFSYSILPKAVHRSFLFGSMDQTTREWTDGIVPYYSRKIVKEPINLRSWLIFDDDIDPEWIESLNSVLDDNKLLTLISGERIQFGTNVNFIFESHDLSFASPATISRLGMILLTKECIDFKALVISWLSDHLHQLTDLRVSLIKECIELYFYSCLDFVVNSDEFIIDCSPVGILYNGLSHVLYVNSREEFAIAMIRGFGSNLQAKARSKFSLHVLKIMNFSCPNINEPYDICFDHSCFTLSTYENDLHFDGTVEIENFDFIGDQKLPLIHTSTVKRSIDLFHCWLNSNFKPNFMMVGPDGCGKETLLFHCVKKLSSTNLVKIYCNSRTLPEDVKIKIYEAYLPYNSNFGRVLYPKKFDNIILYIKNLNIPRPDKWGTVQLVSFIRQIATYRGFYDSNFEWISLKNTQIIITLCPNENVDRFSISSRLTSIFRICYISPSDLDSLRFIYHTYFLRVFQSRFNILHSNESDPDSHLTYSHIHALSNSLIDFYDKACKINQSQSILYTPKHLTEILLQFKRYFRAFADVFMVKNVFMIFVYEIHRVFFDRVNNALILEEFKKVLKEVLVNNWDISLTTNFPFQELYFISLPIQDIQSSSFHSNISDLFYIEPSSLCNKLSILLSNYENEVQSLGIFIFPEVLQHFVQIDRVISKPGGSLILCGRSGVGRHLTLKLVAFYHTMEIISPMIGKDFLQKTFKNLLKSAILKCGYENKPLILLIEDYQLIHISFLELLNNSICFSDFTGIFRRDEYTQLISSLRDQALEIGYCDDLELFFCERIKRNLHLVMVFDISSPNFTSILHENPSLSHHCSIILLDNWSLDSMYKIPIICFQSLAPELQCLFSSESLPSLLVKLFSSVSEISLAPISFLAYLRVFTKIYIKQITVTEHKLLRLHVGICKIDEATKNLAKLRSQASYQQNLLSDKQKEAFLSLQLITDSMEKASEKKIEMEAISRSQIEERHKLEDRKRSIEFELNSIMPLVEQSRNAVSSIKPESIAELRAFRAPPDVIRDILEGMLRLMSVQDTSWNNMKLFLSRRGILEDICHFNVRSISFKERGAIEEFIQSKQKSFDPLAARRASVAAAPLANWVISTLKYCRVLDSIKPLEDEQMYLSKNLDASERKIERLSIGLFDLDREVSSLRGQFEQYTDEAAKLKIDVSVTQNLLNSAENLVNKLDAEKVRWTDQQRSLKAKKSNILSRSLLAASYISFLGSIKQSERHLMINNWRSIIDFVEDFTISTFLSDENEHLTWRHQGLLDDELSIGNAIILQTTHLCPLIIDPNGNASFWLQNYLNGKKLEVIYSDNDNFVTLLELSVRFGKKLLVLDVIDIPLILYPLIKGEFFNNGSKSYVYIGEKQMDIHPEFQLYLISKIPPPVNADIHSFVCVVNFSFTLSGLTSQLLTITVMKEIPELEIQKSNSLLMEEKLKADIFSLEDALLNDLSTSDGNLVENVNLLSSLNETKEKSLHISNSLDESKSLQENIDRQRNRYLTMASKGAQMYFLLESFSLVNHMYRYNLKSYICLFKQALEAESIDLEMESKMYQYTSKLRVIVYDYISRSLFKRDLLTFALHFVHGIHENLFNINEWEYFCGVYRVEDSLQDLNLEYSYDIPSWCNLERKVDINALKFSFPSLYSILDVSNEGLWLEFARSTYCEHHIPAAIVNRLTPFQRLIIIQTLRPDRLKSAMQYFCEQALGFSIFSSSINLENTILQSSSDIPILIIISPGSDPSQELHDVAERTIGIENLVEFPLDEGQEEIVIRKIVEQSLVKSWLCLKNLHLVVEILPVIEKCYSQLQTHEHFRLILTSEQHSSFPVNFLTKCLKISYEFPVGVKYNMLRTYEHWSDDYVALGKNPARSRLLFCLTWFHVVLQERCNFIPFGWSQYYEFSLSDLRAATNFIDRMYQWRKTELAHDSQWWDYIHGVLVNAIYGSKIDHPMDIQIFSSLIKRYFNPDIFLNVQKFAHFNLFPYSYHKSDFVATISQLSSTENSSLLLLQNNLDRNSQCVDSFYVLSQLKLFIITNMNVDHFDRHKWKGQLQETFILWKDLNQTCKLIDQKFMNTELVSEVSPLLDFLYFEYNKSLTIIQVVHNTLSCLKKCLNGSSVISDKMYNFSRSLLSGKVPLLWSEQWSGPCSSHQFLRTIVKKSLALSIWMNNLEKGILFESLINLADLYSPIYFFAALRQHISRAKNIAIDDLNFVCKWRNDRNSDLSLNVTGLHIEGCIFDGKQITQTNFDTPITSPLPPCYIGWEKVNQNDSSNTCTFVSLPLYSSSMRDYMISQILIRCSGRPEIWLQAGVAIYIQ